MTTITETIAITTDSKPESAVRTGKAKPLKLSGALDNYDSFDVTPIIGREFPNASLKEWLEAPNSDELIRDLAITSEYCIECFEAITESSSLATRCSFL